MNELRKMLQLLTDVDNLEDYIKYQAMDGKIDRQVANEILRLLKEAKDRALQ